MLPLTEVQKAVFTTLSGALAPVPVLDAAGPNQLFPYVTIGEFIGGEADTLNEQAVDLELTIHVWSRQPGMQECGDLMQAAKDALDRQRLAVTGFWWVDTIWNYAQTMRDPDGKTRHGILRFRVMTFELTAAAPPPPPAQLAGTVDTDGSASVVWASGDQFTPGIAGKTITIAGADYSIFQYVSPGQVFVDPPVPAASGAAYLILL